MQDRASIGNLPWAIKRIVEGPRGINSKQMKNGRREVRRAHGARFRQAPNAITRPDDLAAAGSSSGQDNREY